MDKCKTCAESFPSIVELCEHRMNSPRCAAELGPYIATYGELAPPDLEAIRKRNEEAKEKFLSLASFLSPDVQAFARIYPDLWADIDALLAEVERLRAQVLDLETRAIDE